MVGKLKGEAAAHYEKGDYFSASTLLKKVLVKVPSIENYSELARCFIKDGRITEARSLIINALRDKGEVAELYDLLGTCYFKEEQFDTALRYFQIAHNVDGSYLSAISNAAMAEIQLNQVDQAIDSLKRLQSINDDLAQSGL